MRYRRVTSRVKRPKQMHLLARENLAPDIAYDIGRTPRAGGRFASLDSCAEMNVARF